jgi:hypothetical protein
VTFMPAAVRHDAAAANAAAALSDLALWANSAWIQRGMQATRFAVIRISTLGLLVSSKIW